MSVEASYQLSEEQLGYEGQAEEYHNFSSSQGSMEVSADLRVSRAVNVSLRSLIDYVDNPETEHLTISPSSGSTLSFQHNAMTRFLFDQEVFYLGGFASDEDGNRHHASVKFVRQGKVQQFIRRFFHLGGNYAEMRIRH